MEKKLSDDMLRLFEIPDGDIEMLSGHEGGRNKIYHCSKGIIRVSELADRTFEDYLAETEFVHYLALNGAPVADTQISVNGSFVEQIKEALQWMNG